MKKVLLICFISFLNIRSQIQNPNNTSVEFYMGTSYVTPIQKPIKISLSSIGTVWGADNNFNFYITNEFSNSSFIPNPNNENIGFGDGWDFVTSRDNQGKYPTFSYGIYKVYTDDSPTFFYIDFRDDRYGRYGNYEPLTYGHDIDIWLKYNDLSNAFSFTSQPSFGFGEPLSNGQLLKIWDIKLKVCHLQMVSQTTGKTA